MKVEILAVNLEIRPIRVSIDSVVDAPLVCSLLVIVTSRLWTYGRRRDRPAAEFTKERPSVRSVRCILAPFGRIGGSQRRASHPTASVPHETEVRETIFLTLFTLIRCESEPRGP